MNKHLSAWFHTHQSLPGVFTDPSDAEAALKDYPGSRSFGIDELFAKQGAFARQMQQHIQGSRGLPDAPDHAGEPGSAAEMYAWLQGFLNPGVAIH